MASKRSRARERESGREKGEERREGVQETERSSEEERGERRSSRKDFRQFVDNLKKKQHRVVEMRVALVSGFAIAARVLLSDQLSDEQSAVVRGSLLFTGSKSLIFHAQDFSDLTSHIHQLLPPPSPSVCIAVIILSTWLDYFPSKLVDIKPRSESSLLAYCIVAA